MKVGHKYLGTPMLYLCGLLLAFLPFMLVEWLLPHTLDWLSLTLGGAIPIYSEITHPEQYAAQEAALAVAEVLVTLLILEAVLTRLDNKRFEYVISKTEGLYTMREGLALYMREFLALDLVIASVLPAASVIACAFIPEIAFEYGAEFPLRLGYELYLHHGAVRASVIIVLCAVTARLISGILALRRYRAVWLSGGDEI